MNLIRNTLIFVVIIQLLGFLYFKLHNTTVAQAPQIELKRTIILPKSHAFTTYMDNPSSMKESISLKETTFKPIVTALLSPEKLQPKISIPHQDIEKPLKKKVTLTQKLTSLNKKVESYAKKLLGFKYVWGATGPKTFDCSGFTQKVYKKTAGINLPRVSRNQAKVGKYIEYDKLQKGDMVFFDTEKKYTKRVNHVGIYLGNNKFIHASSARKKIIITSFKRKPFYKRRFLWGRRVLKDSHHVNVAML